MDSLNIKFMENIDLIKITENKEQIEKEKTEASKNLKDFLEKKENLDKSLKEKEDFDKVLKEISFKPSNSGRTPPNPPKSEDKKLQTSFIYLLATIVIGLGGLFYQHTAIEEENIKKKSKEASQVGESEEKILQTDIKNLQVNIKNLELEKKSSSNRHYKTSNRKIYPRRRME